MAADKTTQTQPPAPPEPTPAEADLANLRLALRGRLGVPDDGLVDDAGLLDLLDEALTRPDDSGSDAIVEPVELENRTILHNLFSYDLPEGGNAIAMRGQTVPLMPHDIERGERFGAFTGIVGEPPAPTGSVLPDYPIEGTHAEQDAWVLAGTVPEIVEAVNMRPEIITSVVAAEQRRSGGPRKTLMESLALMGGGS